MALDDPDDILCSFANYNMAFHYSPVSHTIAGEPHIQEYVDESEPDYRETLPLFFALIRDVLHKKAVIDSPEDATFKE